MQLAKSEYRLDFGGTGLHWKTCLQQLLSAWASTNHGSVTPHRSVWLQYESSYNMLQHANTSQLGVDKHHFLFSSYTSHKRLKYFTFLNHLFLRPCPVILKSNSWLCSQELLLGLLRGPGGTGRTWWHARDWNGACCLLSSILSIVLSIFPVAKPFLFRYLDL